MKRLSKAQWKLITDAMTVCEETAEKLDGAIDVFNQHLEKARDEVSEKVDAYNNAIKGLVEVYSDLAGEAQAYFDERGEKWQESEAGAEYVEWIDRLSIADDVDEAELDYPENINTPDFPDFSDTDWLPPEAPGEG